MKSPGHMTDIKNYLENLKADHGVDGRILKLMLRK